MFQYTHRHGNRQWSFIISYCWGGVGWDNKVHVPVHTQARQQAVVFHHQLLLGWGGIIRFMFQYTHRHGNRQWSFIISYCWGGVGWDNKVHVPVHAQARQQAVVGSCSCTHIGTATGSGLSSSVTAGVGWGGTIRFMFLYTHRHGNRQWSFIISYCWGGVGWDNKARVPVHTQARQQAVVFHHQLLLGWGGVG